MQLYELQYFSAVSYVYMCTSCLQSAAHSLHGTLIKTFLALISTDIAFFYVYDNPEHRPRLLYIFSLLHSQCPLQSRSLSPNLYTLCSMNQSDSVILIELYILLSCERDQGYTHDYIRAEHSVTHYPRRRWNVRQSHFNGQSHEVRRWPFVVVSMVSQGDVTRANCSWRKVQVRCVTEQCAGDYRKHAHACILISLSLSIYMKGALHIHTHSCWFLDYTSLGFDRWQLSMN